MDGRLKIVIEDEFGTPIHFELDFDGVDQLDNALEMLGDSIVLMARQRDLAQKDEDTKGVLER